MQVGKAANALRSWWKQSFWRDLLWEVWDSCGLRDLCGLSVSAVPILLAMLFDAGWIYWLLIVSIPAGALIALIE